MSANRDPLDSGNASNRILLIRHAESFSNIDNQLSCLHVDLPLTPNGISQAKKTAHALRLRKPVAIFTSPLRRARETAEILAKGRGGSVQVVEDFREVNVGTLETEPVSKEVWMLHNRIVAAWAAGTASAKFPMGEDYKTLLFRFRRGLKHVLAEVRNCTSVVVGHGGLFRYTINDICPDASDGPRIEKTITNCSISEIEVRNKQKGIFRLSSWAEDSHLF